MACNSDSRVQETVTNNPELAPVARVVLELANTATTASDSLGQEGAGTYSVHLSLERGTDRSLPMSPFRFEGECVVMAAKRAEPIATLPFGVSLDTHAVGTELGRFEIEEADSSVDMRIDCTCSFIGIEPAEHYAAGSIFVRWRPTRTGLDRFLD